MDYQTNLPQIGLADPAADITVIWSECRDHGQ